jgi:hypothetical protein
MPSVPPCAISAYRPIPIRRANHPELFQKNRRDRKQSAAVGPNLASETIGLRCSRPRHDPPCCRAQRRARTLASLWHLSARVAPSSVCRLTRAGSYIASPNSGEVGPFSKSPGSAWHDVGLGTRRTRSRKPLICVLISLNCRRATRAVVLCFAAGVEPGRALR